MVANVTAGADSRRCRMKSWIKMWCDQTEQKKETTLSLSLIPYYFCLIQLPAKLGTETSLMGISIEPNCVFFMPPNMEVSQFPVEAAWTLVVTLSINRLQLKLTPAALVFSVNIKEKKRKNNENKDFWFTFKVMCLFYSSIFSEKEDRMIRFRFIKLPLQSKTLCFKQIFQ